jgi:hypothetical protein
MLKRQEITIVDQDEEKGTDILYAVGGNVS